MTVKDIRLCKVLYVNKSDITIHVLAQFRTGMLPLHMESCRFKSKEQSEHICIICSSNTGNIEKIYNIFIHT